MRVTMWLLIVTFCLCSCFSIWELPASAQTGNAQRRPQSDSPTNNATQLLTSLQAVFQTNAVTLVQQQAVVKSLTAIFPRRNRPATATLTALANDLTGAVAAGKITPPQAVILSEDVAQVFRVGINNLQATLILVRADIQALRTTSRLTLADIQVISNDVNVLIIPIVQAH
jgi:hypothetical protein